MTVSLDEVNAEIARVESEIQRKARIPGFRPGKVPMSMVRSRFESDIRQEVAESLVPKAFRKRAGEEQLAVVGSPNITDLHFHKGEALRFKAEFEVAPQFELGEYRGLTAPYSEPKATDEDVTARVNQMREQKAEFVNVDPRPLEAGDYAVVALQSVAGLDQPMDENELTLHLGDAETLPEFSENLLGLTPGEEKEFDVEYPKEYGNKKLSGRKVRFLARVKGLRKKELPELSDEFAKDVGDFQSLEELQAEVRKAILRERELLHSQQAKASIIDALVESHQFAVPDAFVDRQIEMSLESRFRELAQQGIDPRQLQINWEEVKKAQTPQAIKDIKASLLLDKIADREAIETTTDEMDREIQRIARQVRESVAATRMKLEKEGALSRLALRIRTDKVLNFLFENARKVAPTTPPPAAGETKEA